MNTTDTSDVSPARRMVDDVLCVPMEDDLPAFCVIMQTDFPKKLFLREQFSDFCVRQGENTTQGGSP